jgi:NTP pyrophosphatase (non-canonical NTP hydrolase)
MLTEEEVAAEIVMARAVHGSFPKDMVRSFVLLSEEVGEVARAVAEVTRLPRHNELRPTHRQNLRTELVQCAAVISMWVANIDLERGREEHEQQSKS